MSTPRQQRQRRDLTRYSIDQHLARRAIRIAERELVITAPREEEPEEEHDNEPGCLFDRR